MIIAIKFRAGWSIHKKSPKLANKYNHPHPSLTENFLNTYIKTKYPISLIEIVNSQNPIPISLLMSAKL